MKMLFERKELGRGVYLNEIHETKFKSNLISVRFIAPLDPNTAAKNALIFPVLLRGSKQFPNLGSIRREEESIYDTGISDSVYKRGDMQILELRMKLLDNRFSIDGMDITARAMNLLTDLLFCPITEDGVFCRDYVEGEKQMLIDDIRAQGNDKRRYARTRLIEEMFEGEAFGTSELGTVESVTAICPTCLWEQYMTLLSCARVEIFAVGNFDFDSLGAQFVSAFSHVNRDTIYSLQTTAMTGARDEVKTVYERQNITQGKLSLGFYTGCTVKDPDYHVMQVLNAVYGSGVTSKLFLNVREKLSLCYYCSSSEDGQKGYMTVNSGIEFANEKKAMDEILVQLEEVKKGNVTESELHSAKLLLIDAVNRVADSTDAMMNWYFGCVMNENVISPDEKRAFIESVTISDVVQKAQAIRLDTHYFLCGKESEAK